MATELYVSLVACRKLALVNVAIENLIWPAADIQALVGIYQGPVGSSQCREMFPGTRGSVGRGGVVPAPVLLMSTYPKIAAAPHWPG